MTEFKRISDAIDFMYNNQGYVDIHLIAKMVGVPEIIVKNVIEQSGFEESKIHGHYIKPQLRIDKRKSPKFPEDWDTAQRKK